ncbi:DUF3363 domain-containing protein [Sphingomonas sp. R647]|uniref:DUF3363 domain-containing protein n=1 Tax=Sphingomonas sp. R647 TaxID=2875233 RepID=UPI0021E5C573|nr:DUF3363 domain-containing protein [Sphingomonas sp. R647]
MSNELLDRHSVMMDGIDGRVHYIEIGARRRDAIVPEGSTVRIDPRSAEATQVDRTIDGRQRIWWALFDRPASAE